MATFTGLHVGYVDCSVFLKAIAQYGKVAILNSSVSSIAKYSLNIYALFGA